AQRVAAQAAALDPGELHRATGVLRVASLVRTSGARGADTIECYHDRMREAVVAHLDEATERQHHEGLANALEAAAGPETDAQARLECRRKAAGHLLITGEIERGLETLSGVLAELGKSLPPTPRRALAGLIWNLIRLRLRGFRFRRRDESEVPQSALVLIDV